MKKEINSFLIIGSYVVITYCIYFLIISFFISHNCSPIQGGLGSGYMCIGFYNFINASRIYFYLLFLFITIGLYLKNTHKYHGYGFVIGSVLLIVVIIFIYLNTPQSLGIFPLNYK